MLRKQCVAFVDNLIKIGKFIVNELKNDDDNKRKQIDTGKFKRNKTTFFSL